MVLLQAPPGAGKSTWLPLQLVRDGHFKHIVMLEPRRLAARNIAAYLAQCQNEPVGASIGLRIRQEKQLSKHTKLEIVTEGMLTRMLQQDPALEGVDCLIFDEFHERSIAADTALAFALETQAALREDLRILLMSATLDADNIQATFACPVIRSEGRSYPIIERYHPLKNDQAWLQELPTVIRKAMAEQAGSCLVFLPGQREIKQVAHALASANLEATICPLYGDQSKAEQQAAIAPAPAGKRKIVLATNVAETSLTIEGIRIVIDSGKRRAAKFNLNTGVTELKTVNISLASATQRAGRAGRMAAGVVYRLGSPEAFARREAHDTPDILVSDISALLLETKQWGTALAQLQLIDHPSLAQQQQALALLRMLEAVDADDKISALGRELLAFGTDIRWAHMLLKAKALAAQVPGIDTLAIYLLALWDSGVAHEPELRTSLQAQLHTPQPAFTKQLKYWLARLQHQATAQLDMALLPVVVALAYPDRLAKRRGEGYLLANGGGVECRSDCWLGDEYVAIAALGGPQGKHIYSATAADISQLETYLPHLFGPQRVCEFIEKDGRFLYEDRSMLGAIVASAKPIGDAIDEEVRAEAWLRQIRKHGLALFSCYTTKLVARDNSEVAQLLTRMMLAHRHEPDTFPTISEQQLVATAEQWLAPYLRGVKNLDQLRKFDLYEPLQNCFDWPTQTALNTLLPKRLSVPSGSSIRIVYQLDGPAKLSVRMQEVYGLAATPPLCNGRIPLLMDLLSPAHRSLQLTEDLAGFWRGSYHAIKKEMKGRYPKHYWPDQPELATATSKTKAKM